MARSGEAITKGFSEKLFAYLKELSEQDTRIKTLYDEYRVMNYSTHPHHALKSYSPEGPKVKDPLYSNFETLINIVGVTGKEVYEALGYTVEWPEYFEGIVSACEGLSFLTLSRVKSLVGNMVSDSNAHIECQPFTPTLLCRILYAKRLPRRDRVECAPDYFKSVWEDRSQCTRIATEDISRFACDFGYSAHFILGLSEQTGFYSKNPAVDSILDYFSLIPGYAKQAVYNGIVSIAAKAENEKGEQYAGN